MTATLSRRAFLTLGVTAALGATGTLATLARCDGAVYEVDGVIVGKYGNSEYQNNTVSPWTLIVCDGDYRWWVPVAEYEYRRHEVGNRVSATGADGNVWMVTS